jgi:phosphate transport system permease protein
MSVPTTGSPSVVAATVGESSVRRQMAAATGRIKRLKRIDRLAVGVITLGGVAVVVSVIGILFFIAAEAMPLFRAPTASPARSVTLAGSTANTMSTMAALGVDETRRYIYSAETNGEVAFYTPDTGVRILSRPVAPIAGAVVTASSRSLTQDFVALGTNDGRVALLQVRFTPVHADGAVRDVTVDVADRGLVAIDAAGRPVQRVAYLEEGERTFVAAQMSSSDVALWWTDDSGTTHQDVVRPSEGSTVTAITVGRTGTAIAGTDRGEVYYWELGDAASLSDTVRVGTSPITSLGYVIGNHTLIAGTADGKVSGWFRAPVGADDALKLVRVAEFEPQRAAITAFAASTRDRTFATAGADGEVVLRHQTSGRTLLTLAGTGSVTHLVMTPRSDGVLAVRANGIDQFALSNPHPEVSWRTLFGKVWYEDYAAPEYVWQSTAGTDDFEPKFSLVPLVFGTIKGTVYALLFAIPLAVFGALYTSQFVHPNVRARIKPTVEIMAALPSVVIGFIAGLYLAPMVERNLVAVMLMMAALPVFGTSGFFLRSWLPAAVQRKFRPGSELLLILPLLLLAAWVALTIAPAVEGALFSGDARQWLSTTLGITYDQRNSLVVGLAMGFAIIPIIFTISEDAFSSVPATLSAASLALGASRWQTAVRVIIPTASPGVFSAIMVGFGRAVGETMIVLMATGNTPVMDWSPFNGFRTLSANIAVEIPEAPHGGTLYRTLFLAAALLFLMTFTVNTVAEIIRQRLRERYKAV